MTIHEAPRKVVHLLGYYMAVDLTYRGTGAKMAVIAIKQLPKGKKKIRGSIQSKMMIVKKEKN